MSSVESLGPGDFGKGTKKRLPICFCLDVSGSMKGERIDSLNSALKIYFSTIAENAEAIASVDIAIVTYGGYVDVLQKFSPINSIKGVPEVEVRPKSFTPMGEGILASLKLLELRKQGYKDRGMKYYQPWLVLITDGKPEGPDADKNFEEALSELNKLEREEKMVVFNIGVSDDADIEFLTRISVKRSKPISANEKNLREYFQFLGSSSTNVVKGGSTSELYQEVVPDKGNQIQDTESDKKDEIVKPENDFDLAKWCI